MRDILVSLQGDGEFSCIQAAIDSVPQGHHEPTVIRIQKGVYCEKVQIAHNKCIHLIGDGPEQSIITFADYARKPHSDGREYGTFRTPTMTVEASDFVAEQLTIANTAGYGSEVGQAIALAVTGDRAVLRHVHLRGNQDTLFTGGSGHQYFFQCYIEGHVDYIFGPASVLFDHCHIHSLRKGFITAASTPADVELGCVFLDCTLTGAAQHIAFLGRPWRPFASVTFLRTFMDRSIWPEGWDNWRNAQNELTARFAEFESSGPGAATADRVSWAKVSALSDITPESTLSRVLAQSDGTQWPWTEPPFAQKRLN